MKQFINALLFFLCASLLSSCVCTPIAEYSADNQNAEIYILNFSSSDVSVTYSKTVKTLEPETEVKYSEFSAFKEKYYEAYEEDCDSRILYADNAELLPYNLNSIAFLLKADSLTGTKFSIDSGNAKLLNSEVKEDLKTAFFIEYDTICSNEYTAYMSENHWKNGNLLFSYDEDAAVEMIVFWTFDADNKILTSPKYIIIIPPEEC